MQDFSFEGMNALSTSDLIPLLVRYTSIPSRYDADLKTIIINEFANSEFLAAYIPTTPDWTLMLTNAADGRMCGFFNLVDRQGFLDRFPAHMGGLMNFVIMPEYRGRGLARLLLQLAKHVAWRVLQFDVAIGFPNSDRLVRFYRHYGFLQQRFRFKATQPSGSVESDVEAVVEVNPGSKMWLKERRFELIDLNGYPW